MPTTDLKFKSLAKWIALASMAVVAFASPAWASEIPVRTQTVRNLQAAYNQKVNTYVSYLAYAERAQEEEYGEVASLFRAAACAEHVQQRNLAAALRKMGFEPGRRISPPIVKATVENLQRSANDIESSGHDAMFSKFIKEAEAEGNENAARAFRYVAESESQHARLFKAAPSNLHRMSADESHLYYVCNVCGAIAERSDKLCPICGDPKAGYEEMF